MHSSAVAQHYLHTPRLSPRDIARFGRSDLPLPTLLSTPALRVKEPAPLFPLKFDARTFVRDEPPAFHFFPCTVGFTCSTSHLGSRTTRIDVMRPELTGPEPAGRDDCLTCDERGPGLLTGPLEATVPSGDLLERRGLGSRPMRFVAVLAYLTSSDWMVLIVTLPGACRGLPSKPLPSFRCLVFPVLASEPPDVYTN